MDRLEALKKITKEINSSMGLAHILDMTLENAIKITNAERGFIMLEGINGVLDIMTARNIDQCGDKELSISMSIVHNVYKTGISVITHNAMEDKRFESPSIEYFGLRSIIAVPLFENDKKIMGVIYVDNRFKNGVFDKEDLNFMNIYASEISMAINREKIQDEKNRLNSILERTVSSQIAEKIKKDGDEINFRGEKKEAAIMFTDIRDFTNLAENTPAEILLNVLNKYFEVMTDIILKRSGCLMKFLGDGFMAAFGIPLMTENYREKAILAAFDMLNSLNILNEFFQKEYGIILKIGIGIHSGAMTAGIIGSRIRHEYTVIGDIPNTASRLEGLTKEYRTNLIVSEKVLSKTNLEYMFKPIGNVSIRGKKEKIRVFKPKEEL